MAREPETFSVSFYAKQISVPDVSRWLLAGSLLPFCTVYGLKHFQLEAVAQGIPGRESVGKLLDVRREERYLIDEI